MNRKQDAGCCAPGDPTPTDFRESVELGERRRGRLIRIAALASALLCAAGILVPFAVQSGTATLAAQRLLWIAALLGAPLLLVYTRELLANRTVAWQLIVAVGLLAVGLLGFPLVPAVASAVALGTRALQTR